jgi:deaminated glutathione amidase
MLAAVIQLTSSTDVEANLARAADWIERAARAGAKLVALPENLPCMRDDTAGPHPAAQTPDGRVVRFLREQAKQHGIVLAGGSFPEAIPGEERVHNTSLVIEANGEVAARYRKIHLFDVDLPEAQLMESRGVAPGGEVVVARTSAGVLGLSICYDVRFPELYRELAARGAEVLLVPAAFTVPTGRDHWEVLLRARAIENQAFVLAAAQYGMHSARRSTYGRSMIIDPWGLVLARVPDGEGMALAELDMDHLTRIRRQLPALRHRRLGLKAPADPADR